jgi:diaminopimelate epimerase
MRDVLRSTGAVPPGLRFVTGHGTRNDFVLVPSLEAEVPALTPGQVRALCDRRSGVGGDGLIRVVPTWAVPALASMASEAPWCMDYANADGSPSEMCGNGIRVMARYLDTVGGLGADGTVRIATRGGVRTVRRTGAGEYAVEMGLATPLDRPVQVHVGTGAPRPGRALTVPNPHVVVAVDDVADAGPLDESPVLTPAELMPDGANVEFVTVLAPDHVRMRVWERGVGETASCGTGACAAAWVTMERTGACDVRVDVPGGALRVRREPDGQLVLIGPAVLVAEGRWLDDGEPGEENPGAGTRGRMRPSGG